MRLILFSKHFYNNLNINNNIVFVIQIEIYLIKMNNKMQINIFEKTIFYCFVN